MHYGTRLFILVKYQLLILILINTVCFPTDMFDISLIENFNIWMKMEDNCIFKKKSSGHSAGWAKIVLNAVINLFKGMIYKTSIN